MATQRLLMSLQQSKDWNPTLTWSWASILGPHLLNGLYTPVKGGPNEGKDPQGEKESLHWRSGNEYPYFEKKSEVQRGRATCLRAHSSYPEADLGCLLSELKRSGENRSVCGGGVESYSLGHK